MSDLAYWTFSSACSDCGTVLPLSVLHVSAGWFLGYMCPIHGIQDQPATGYLPSYRAGHLELDRRLRE